MNTKTLSNGAGMTPGAFASGDRVVLEKISSTLAVEPGDVGTVVSVTPAPDGTMMVCISWDNGASIAVDLNVDRIRKLAR